MSKTLAPSVTTRDPKGLKFMSIVDAAYNKACLTEEEAQCVNDTPGLADLVSGFIAENRRTGRFADEEVSSNYAYPPEYQGPKPIVDQIEAIAKIFGLDPANALAYAKALPPLESFVPADALPWTGWFAVALEDAISAKHFPEVTDPADQYCRAVQLVHGEIAESRPFHNYREGQITPAHLRQHARSIEYWNRIRVQQPGDIKVVAAQLGMRHRGRSVRRAREVFVGSEFGLGSLAVGSIVLTHPARLVRYEELDMDCAGDEFAPEAVGDFSNAPIFSFSDGRVRFGAVFVDFPCDYYGSASGFLPAEAR